MRFLHFQRGNQSGQALVELLIAIALSAILLPTLAGALALSREGRGQELQRTKAATILQELNEATRSIRNKGWSQFAVNGSYNPVITGNQWAFEPGPVTVDGIVKEVIISDALRDTEGNITDSGGTIDPSTKQVITQVSFEKPLPEILTHRAYFHRYDNTTWNQTSQAEFNSGEFINTQSVNNAGGEVQLTQGTIISWATPQIIDGFNTAGATDGSELYFDVPMNRVYLVTGTIFYIFDVTNRTAVTLLGSFNVGSAIQDIYALNNFVYVSSSSGTVEFQIIDVSNPANPVNVRSINLPGTTAATSVTVNGSYAYVGKIASAVNGQNELYVINVAIPTSAAVTGSLNLTGSVNALTIDGDYAYLATSIGTAELSIINISNKALPQPAGVFNAPGTAVGTDVAKSVGGVYVSTNANAGGAEFYILDAANTASPSLLGSYETNLNVNSIDVVGSRAFLALARSNEQLTVLNISDSNNPVRIGSANLQNNDANSVMFSDDIAYVASSANNRELTIMTGQESGGGFATSGEFISPVFDAGSQVGFNNFSFARQQPVGSTLTMQIATNNDNATWNYVGPDGTVNTFYTLQDAIPLNLVAGRYFRYRAFFSGDGVASPILESTRVNYSL